LAESANNFRKEPVHFEKNPSVFSSWQAFVRLDCQEQRAYPLASRAVPECIRVGSEALRLRNSGLVLCLGTRHVGLIFLD
jgi:hypothetical protein